MTYRGGARRLASFWRVAAVAYLCAEAGCGPSQAGAGTCNAQVPGSQACNTLTDVGAAVTPTCTTAAIPAGTGGTIVDGMYTLTAQTYYGTASCEQNPVSATLVIASGCIQEASGAPTTATVSTTYTVSGATITRTPTCLNVVGVDAGSFSLDTTTLTFTATATTFTVFIKNSGTSSPNPDRVETYTKR
jgi:hypothetical protein